MRRDIWRRNIWLAGVAGVVVGSWLTLVAMQVSEHGFHLRGRATSKTEAENQPAAAAALKPAPIEVAQADITPAQTLTDTVPKKTLPATEPQATPTAQLAQSETAPATAPDAQPAPKNTTDAQGTKTEPEQAKPEPASAPRAPADQADRAAAAAAHRTVPMPPFSQQASPGDSQTPSDDQKQAGGTEPVELTRPSSDQAGMLTVGNRSVQLSGIIPTDVGRMCAGSDGKSWPCGAAARTAFRMYLRGRIIDCDLPSQTWQGTVTGNCRYVRIDLSEWLVRFGWAEPEAGSPLAAVAEQAKQQKRGIYGDDPRKGRKSTLAPAPAKEDPLNPI